MSSGYHTPGSRTRHFVRKYANPPLPVNGVLTAKFAFINHAEAAHGTVVQGHRELGINWP
ncbi:hypothetical protein ACJ72_00387 [Emergomyces africanus]|uniref:Uncharacterized protein n=1 Tax=Emergomyces africanus TaxID=1955775 RepID=A0A1B7P8I7_9EURO|nr:hypothetical protein ACJ72_00387 [Emergomyces africanus]